MIDNKIYAWNPIDKIPKQLYLHSLQHESGVLTIYLSTVDVDRELSIVFDRVIACQSVIETCSLERLEKDTLLSTEWPLFLQQTPFIWIS
ncbi:hypothetical protein [Sphingobacterium bambusae]|uniref:hypothetical protein n=1 Tax=Sphingobacterium bambusae TaxID=662858 RepID=UPI0036D2C820